MYLTQTIIFVKKIDRCEALCDLLMQQEFPAIALHKGMSQQERWVLCGRCGEGGAMLRNYAYS